MIERLLQYIKRIESGIILNILIIFASFGLGFSSLFFKIQGVPLFKIIIIWAISPLTASLVTFLCDKWNLRIQFILGILSHSGMTLSLLFFNDYSYLAYGIFNGFAMSFYWVSVNYIFFSKSKKNNHAKDWNIYFLIGPIFGILLPPIGALIIGSFGFKILFFITTIFSLIPLMYVYKSEFNQTFYSNFYKANKDFSGLRLYSALNDSLHFFGNFIAIYILLFLTTEYEIGGFMSGLALISFIISFFISDISDKTHKRSKFLNPLLLIMGILIFLMMFIKSSIVFILAIGSYTILSKISLPIRYAILVDNNKKDIGFWRVAEVYGNLGRFVIFILSSLFLYLGFYQIPFIIFSLISFSMLLIIKFKFKNIA